MRRLRAVVLRTAIALALLVLSGCVVQTFWWERAVDRFEPPGRFIEIADGRRVHLVCEGAGTPTVVMDAGGTHDATQYLDLIRVIGRRVTACAYDRAGMGWSDPSPTHRTARALADDLEAILESAGRSPPYVLVGSSAGGMTVELYAREHPDDVVGVVLLDALSGSFAETMDRAVLRDHAETLRRDACLARSLNRIGLLRLLDPLDRRGRPDPERALALTYRNQTWDAICSMTTAFSTSAEQLRSAPPLARDMPIVVVTRDPAIGDGGSVAFERAWHEVQARAAARSSRGEVRVATGSGHHVWEDRPDLAARAIVRVVEAR